MANSKKYNQAVGLSIQLSAGSTLLIHATSVSHSKGKLVIEDSLEFSTIASAMKKLGTSNPFLLNVYGQGVLNKRVNDLVPGEVNISNKAIPGINLSEYFTAQIIYSTHGWVSLTKRTVIDELISSISAAGGFVIGLNLGFAGLGDLAKVASLDGVFPIRGQAVTIDQGAIQTLAKTDAVGHTVSLEDQELSSSHLLAYGAALNYFIDSSSVVSDAPLLEDHAQGYTYQCNSSNVLKAGLAAIMLIALGNAYYFNGAYQSNEALKVTVQTQQPLLEKVSALKTQKDQLEAAVGPLNSTTTQQAYYIDQIGASLSKANILLTTLDIYPIISDRKKIGAGIFEFEGDLIIIEGTSKDPAKFGQWVNALRALEWVESVEISPFQRNESGGNGFVVRVGG